MKDKLPIELGWRGFLKEYARRSLIFLLVVGFWVALIVLAILLSGCTGLPTVEPTVTPPPTASPALPTQPMAPGATNTASVGTVKVTGNVWLRDSVGNRRGYLFTGAQVLARCVGDWCYVGNLKFYRGCASDNPAALTCRMEE